MVCREWLVGLVKNIDSRVKGWKLCGCDIVAILVLIIMIAPACCTVQ